MSNETQNEITVDRAEGILQREYYADVRGVVEDVQRAIKDGEIKDAEELDTYLHETCDGHGRVIYTRQAQWCLMFSDNDNAGPEEMGSEAFDWSSGIPWSQLAYFAFRADVRDMLEREGVDLNDPVPEEEENDDASENE